MATFTAIPEKTQTANAMKRVLDYVMQDKKTMLNDIKLVSGQNCVPESAYQEFMATKQQYRKAKGVFFKQYVQSFKPDCGATPEQIHKIGLETAKAFDGFEVVVATHIDCDHWHNHFVVNSVNCETGYKIQINEKGLEQLRQRSDEICQQYGLQILPPYQKPEQRTMNQREYRAALRGDSKKLKLANAIDYAVAKSQTKQQFIEQLQKLGYGVKWIDHYKYITYYTPNGQRFRDNRLLDDKYLKGNMEELFAYGFKQLKTDKSDTTSDGGYDRGINRTGSAYLPDAQAGTVQSLSKAHLIDWERHCAEHGFDIRTADAGGTGRTDKGNDSAERSQNAAYHGEWNGLDQIFRRAQFIEADGEFQGSAPQGYLPDDGGTESEGLDAVEIAAEMGRDWSDIAVNGLYLAADLAMIGSTDNDNPKPKYISERKHGQKKNNHDEHSQDEGYEVNM